MVISVVSLTVTFANFTVMTPALTLIAATLYSQERFDNGQIYSAWHLLPVPEEVDDQDYEFESYDLEVEALAQAGEKT